MGIRIFIAFALRMAFVTDMSAFGLLPHRRQFIFGDSSRSSIRHSPYPGTVANEGKKCYAFPLRLSFYGGQCVSLNKAPFKTNGSH